MHDSHHEGMLDHDIEGATEDDTEGEEHGFAPRHAALHIVVREQTAQIRGVASIKTKEKLIN